MRRTKIWAGTAAIMAITGTAVAAANAGGGTSTSESTTPVATSRRLPAVCRPGAAPKPTSEIATAKMIIEYNSTDGDLGVHGAFDDDGWRRLCVFDPTGRAVLAVGPHAQLRDLAMAGIFFESREPPLSEFSFADLRATFPEGEYAVRARSFDGKTLVGSAMFTHDVPGPPEITSPALVEEPRGVRRRPVSRDDLVVAWERVTETVDGRPIEISGYEVIVTKEVDDDPHGFSRPTYDVHAPPNITSLRVPKRFLESGTVYELEVLALEVSGNQTISVGFFETM